MSWFKRKSKTGDDAAAGKHIPEAEAEPAAEAPPVEEPAAGEDATAPAPGEDPPPEPADTAGEKPRAGYISRLRQRLSRTRRSFSDGMEKIFSGRKTIDAAALEELEELLITSDIGVQTAAALIQALSSAKTADAGKLRTKLCAEVLSILKQPAPPPDAPAAKPHVIMVVGVNGVGKTTTIGKIAARMTSSGSKVLIAAADTFRAAAVEQLSVWAERAGAGLIRHKEGADPAAVAFDAVDAALARDVDAVIVDTAGRLHTKVNLMEEIKKIKRSIAKKLPDAPHEILLVLDATTGQNAISQARLFHEALDLSGIVLTKLDGTAKGGIVIAICREFNIPLKYVGIGEAIDDLQDFDPESFVEALFKG